MVERADFSPSGNTAYQGRSFRERHMLRSIAAAASRLPEGEFDEKGAVGRLHAFGNKSETQTIVNLTERLPQEGDDVARFTAIKLGLSAVNPRLLTSLEADTYISDDVADMHGLSPKHETFVLGDEGSDLSMKRVMQYMRLATRTVEGARTLEYLARPEASMPQTF